MQDDSGPTLSRTQKPSMDRVILIFPRIEGSEKAVLPPLSLISISTFLLGRYDVRVIDQRIDLEWRRTSSANSLLVPASAQAFQP